MRIAQLAPLFEAVPPLLYGGTERVVHWLTEALVKKGVDVTLFASGDSQTSAELVPMCKRALRLDGSIKDANAVHCVEVEEMFRRSSQFDVVHAHIDYAPFARFRQMKTPSLTTMHARVDSPEMKIIFNEFKEQNMVSISKSQQSFRPEANWVGTVYHGLPIDMYEFQAHSDDYLLFLGRICREKRVDLAIEIARRAGMHLKVAAKVDPADRQYFEKEIKHLLELPWVEYIGEANDAEKQELLGHARALLFPIDWPEPFGLVMIEAMACGTPVIAFNVSSAAEAVACLDQISRYKCRRQFESKFTSERMADGYLCIYKTLIEQSNGKRSILVPKVFASPRSLNSEPLKESEPRRSAF
jgi:glycosyltransferase involved in cell wall biosynthesis